MGDNAAVTSPARANAPSLLAIPLPPGTSDTSLRNDVASRLMLAIAMGEYLPGERLPPERDLAAALRVARVTVRAGIGVLTELGLLRSQQGRGGGTFVVRPETEKATRAVEETLAAARGRLSDQLVAESWLHGMIAGAAAARHEPVDVPHMRALVERFRLAPSGVAKQQADKQLHLCIGEAAHSPALHGILLSAERELHLVAPAYPWGDKAGHRDREHRAAREHQELVEAIVARDIAEAQRIGRTHAHINREILDEALARWKRR